MRNFLILLGIVLALFNVRNVGSAEQEMVSQTNISGYHILFEDMEFSFSEDKVDISINGISDHDYPDYNGLIGNEYFIFSDVSLDNFRVDENILELRVSKSCLDKFMERFTFYFDSNTDGQNDPGRETTKIEKLKLMTFEDDILIVDLVQK